MIKTPAFTVDLNADVGEGMAADAGLFSIITSANVSCAAHAGDADTIRSALLLAKEHRVTVGAHVGYFDVANFGRSEKPITDETIHSAYAACLFQIGALIAYAKHFKVKVRYVKPHGALYNQACRDWKLGEAVAAACDHFRLPLMILAHSPLHKKLKADTTVIAEGFADRAYRKDGSLMPRNEPGAVLHDIPTIVKQAEWLVRKKKVDSICIHSDTPNAVTLATNVREGLETRGAKIKSFASM